MALTKEQSIKLLLWGGYTKGTWVGWFDPKGEYLNGLDYRGDDGQYEPPNTDDLKVLMNIVENKVDSYHVGFNKNPKKHRDIWYHVWIGIKSPKLHVESKSKSLVEALQQALLKLVDMEK